MEGKILSISIAAYNVSRFLRQALDSLTVDAAHMDKLDIIVVNDGSADDTADIAREYALRFPGSVRVIDQENGGYGSTINASLAAAKGKYYRLLDGDDWYEPQGLCALIDFLEETDSDMVVNPYYTVRDQAALDPHHPEVPGVVTPIADLAVGEDPIFHMHGVTVRTKALRDFAHPIARHCFYTDIEFVFYCVMASETIVRFETPVYNYRLGVGGQSVSLKGLRSHYRDFETVVNRICGCYSEYEDRLHGAKREILKQAVAFAIYGMFNGHMLQEKPDRRALERADRALEKQYPAAHALGDLSRIVRWTRRLRFHGYRVLCGYMLRKHMRCSE